MTADEIQKYALNIAKKRPQAELTHPFGSEVNVFKVMGKMFMLTSELNGQKFINLKCDPQYAEMLRDHYDSIRTGYHMNKRHWISIYSGEQITRDLIDDLVKNSYALVTQNLTKAQKNILKIHSQID